MSRNQEILEANVAAGVEMLDRQIPNWRDHVDPRTLRMERGCSCIVGQLRDARIDGRLTNAAVDELVSTEPRYGFMLPYDGLDEGGDELVELDGWMMMERMERTRRGLWTQLGDIWKRHLRRKAPKRIERKEGAGNLANNPANIPTPH